MPFTYRITDTGENIWRLDTLFENLEQLYRDCNIDEPKEIIDAIRIMKSSILNPSSHDDVKSPIYGKELKDGINVVTALEGLPKINREKLINAGTHLFIEIPNKKYSMKFRNTQDIFVVITFDGSKLLSSLKCEIIQWTLDGIDFGIFAKDGTVKPLDFINVEKSKQERTLDELINGICKSLAITTTYTLEEQYGLIKVSAKSLQELRDEA